jgi:hypothetical protein
VPASAAVPGRQFRKEYDMTFTHATRLRSAGLAAVGAILCGSAALPAQDSSSQDRQQQQQSGTSGGQESRSSGQQAQAPAGFVLIQERVVTVTANEPQNHFLRAAEFWTEGNKRAAAGEIRIAAQYLDMQASRGQGRETQELTRAAQELRSTADQLQQGNPSGRQAQGGQGQQDQQPSQQGQQDQQQARQGQEGQQGQAGQQGQESQQGQQQWQRQQLTQRERQTLQRIQRQAKELTQAFARANGALAQFFQSRAQAAIQKQHTMMAGHELQGAADALAAAVVWSGQQPPQETSRAITQAHQLAMQLGAGQEQTSGEAQQAGARSEQGQQQDQSGQAPQQADQIVQDLGKAIESVQQSIGSSSSGRASGTGSGGSDSQQTGQQKQQ